MYFFIRYVYELNMLGIKYIMNIEYPLVFSVKPISPITASLFQMTKMKNDDVSKMTDGTAF